MDRCIKGGMRRNPVLPHTSLIKRMYVLNEASRGISEAPGLSQNSIVSSQAGPSSLLPGPVYQTESNSLSVMLQLRRQLLCSLQSVTIHKMSCLPLCRTPTTSLPTEHNRYSLPICMSIYDERFHSKPYIGLPNLEEKYWPRCITQYFQNADKYIFKNAMFLR